VTQMQVIYDAGNILVYVLAGVCLLFVAVYSVLAPWWRSAVGRNQVELVGALGLIAALAIVRQLAGGDAAWFAWLRLAVFAVIPFAVVRRTVLLVGLQLRSRRATRRGGRPAR